MRHKVAGFKLGRNTAHRRSLLRNLVTSVIVEERVETTVPKAKAAKPIVEKMITLGKRGDLAARRLAYNFMQSRDAVKKLFDEIAPRFKDRAGGYTRVVKFGMRRGDAAPLSIIEFTSNENAEAKTPRKKRAARRDEQQRGERRAAATA
jgi:large subunit ribosomal protein L17